MGYQVFVFQLSTSRNESFSLDAIQNSLQNVKTRQCWVLVCLCVRARKQTKMEDIVESSTLALNKGSEVSFRPPHPHQGKQHSDAKFLICMFVGKLRCYKGWDSSRKIQKTHRKYT